MNVSRFLTELKGRGVYRVAAIYAAGTWALLQVADILFPMLGFPAWAITTVLAAAALGFPIAIVLAWLFDITPQGIVETDTVDINFERLRLSPAHLIELTLLMALIFLVGFLYLDRLSLIGEAQKRHAATEAEARPSIAVMPFVNMSDAPEVEYFGDGLAEEILNLLARLNELNVAARTSSFYFKGRNDVDILQIAERLGVRHVLEGSVRRQGNRVRVTAQLIDARDGFHMWSETYDRDFSDTFLIQDEIARQVVDSLQLILSPNSQQILEKRPALVPEAYDYYLRARDYMRSSLSADSLDSAIALFTKAIDLDGSYVEAYAGLCDAYLGQYRNQLDPEQFQNARLACDTVLSLDEQALPVYVALGNLYRSSGEYDLALEEFNKALSLNPASVGAYDGLGETYKRDNKPGLAEAAFQKAIELQPNYRRGYVAMGNFLFAAGRFEEAIPYFQRNTELMPDDAQAFTNLGAAYALTNQFEQAAEASRRSLELAPTAIAYSNAGSSLFFLGRFEDAVDMYQKAVEYAPENSEYWGNLGDAYKFTETMSELAEPMYANAIKLALTNLNVNPFDAATLSLVAHYYAGIGDREQSLQYIARATALAPDDMYVYYSAVTALCSLGELDRAMTALKQAVDLGYPRELVSVDAGFRSLRGMERFENLVAAQE
ncbi:MAG: FlgO family outer membrane protein [Gammaproteobacteria bacterium]|nr:FlgO family outer membrane protein [Gammaproteobacteria bacterium]